MSRSWTLAQLRTRLERAIDTEGDTHLSSTEKNDAIAAAAAEVWDVIVQANPDAYVTSQDFTTTAGQLEYALSTIITADDFYKVQSLYVNEGNGQFRSIPRVNPSEVQSFRPVAAAVSMRLKYIPCCSTFKSSGSYSDSATFDGINGFEEAVVHIAAAALRAKREEDTGFHRSRAQEIMRRVVSSGHADWSGPSRVVRRRSRLNRDPFYVYQNNVNAWLYRNGKLELMYLHGFVP